ncbi:hypothetical protein [Burkholderia sp. F1]|uniref:hypothetical protein n=1 Tax=Burkholderia sp. F1 TaxID=3366817 RepID=UPI003D7551BC
MALHSRSLPIAANRAFGKPNLRSVATHTQRAVVEASAPAPAVPVVKPTGMTLANAHRAWARFTPPGTTRKTLSNKSLAVSSFVKHVSLAKPVAGVTRTDVAEWMQAQRSADLSMTTIVNKLSYRKGIFECAGPVRAAYRGLAHPFWRTGDGPGLWNSPMTFPKWKWWIIADSINEARNALTPASLQLRRVWSIMSQPFREPTSSTTPDYKIVPPGARRTSN